MICVHPPTARGRALQRGKKRVSMNRRKFISKSTLLSAGSLIAGKYSFSPESAIPITLNQTVADLYSLFKNPPLYYHPFVRWWWNGNKVEAKELVRELRLLKDAGIGGVEINPVEFPTRFEGDDMGKPSLKWLSDEWIDMLKMVFDEAKIPGDDLRSYSWIRLAFRR